QTFGRCSGVVTTPTVCLRHMTHFRFAVLSVLLVAFGAGGCARKAAPQLPPSSPPPAAVGAVPPPSPPTTRADGPAPTANTSVETEDMAFARKSVAELNADRPLADALFAVDQSTLLEPA